MLLESEPLCETLSCIDILVIDTEELPEGVPAALKNKPSYEIQHQRALAKATHQHLKANPLWDATRDRYAASVHRAMDSIKLYHEYIDRDGVGCSAKLSVYCTNHNKRVAKEFGFDAEKLMAGAAGLAVADLVVIEKLEAVIACHDAVSVLVRTEIGRNASHDSIKAGMAATIKDHGASFRSR